jgi:parallel beta-helix repeat protein
MVFILIFLSGLICSFRVELARANSTIYINADGSITPPSSPIFTTDNITYTLTGNLSSDSSGIVIERDNIVVDGAGYTLQGTNADESRGTDVTGRSNVTIKSMPIKTFYYGIYLNHSSNNNISGNNITDNRYGIYLYSSSSHNSISGNNIVNNRGSIRLDSSSGNGISENNITNNYYGIYLFSSSTNIFSENNITANNWDGIHLDHSFNNTISGNMFTNDGLSVQDSYQNSVENNTVDGRTLVYLEGVSNITVDDAGQVVLVRCENITVEGLNLSRTTVGVELSETSNSTISGNNVANSSYGIWLESSSNNSLSGNNVADSNYGVWLESSSCNNSMSENNVTNNSDGIKLDSSSNNSISGNNVTNDGHGILLASSSSNSIDGNNITANVGFGIIIDYSCSSNQISGNRIAANSYGGIYIELSSNNTIYHNSFNNNNSLNNQVYSKTSDNVWDDGYPSGGNYWSDYNGTDSNQDGIGDTPYVIDANNTDHYPLMGTFQSFNVSALNKFEEVEIVSNSTIEYVEFPFNLESSQYPWEILLKVHGQNGTTGFCRITFQNDLLNSSSYPVYVADHSTLNRIVESNGTHTTLYFTFNQTLSDYNISILPEFPTLLVLPLFMIATLLAMIVCRRRHLI